MTFPKTKKNPKSSPLNLLRDLSRNPGPGRRLLKKKRKRNVNDVPNDKKKPKNPLLSTYFVAQAEIRNPGPGRRPLKKKRKRNVFKNFFYLKKKIFDQISGQTGDTNRSD
jgi:hypothetical protein